MSVSNKKSIDMTSGALWNKILLFALPLAASSILQQLFNSVDTAVVGRFASSQALAAVGSNSSLISLMINLFMNIIRFKCCYCSLYRREIRKKHTRRNSYSNTCCHYKRIFCYDCRSVHSKTCASSYGNTGGCY